MVCYFFRQSFALGPRDTIWASVTVDGTKYEAFSTVPPRVAIDSLTFVYQEGGGLGLEEDEGYRIHVHFQDSPDYKDYAELWVDRGGTLRGEYYLYDGKFSDGNAIPTGGDSRP